MKTRIFPILLILMLSACAVIREREDKRRVQTEIVSRINEKSEDFSKCAKDSDLFNTFNKPRIRVVLYLSINSKGQIERFKLDDKHYPDSFSECIFKISDIINFPRVKDQELIELEQPFIFSKK